MLRQKSRLCAYVRLNRELEDSANKGEGYERDTMYPRFIRQARKDANEEAAQCFTWARAAEAEHFKLFTAAARNLDQMKGGPRTYYVCSEGGYTMEGRGGVAESNASVFSMRGCGSGTPVLDSRLCLRNAMPPSGTGSQ
jgi:hypothetical protein